jgi:putative endonuclease
VIPRRYYTYILTNKCRTVLYTGVTNGLKVRVWQHKNKTLPGFTNRYNLNRLLYFEMFSEIRNAIAREKQIKGWSRAKKVALVISENPGWNDLSDGWFDGGDSSLRSE